jgi:excinuclease UvrABC nuclease subunit
MRLQNSLPFDPAAGIEAWLDSIPSLHAVFALYPDSAASPNAAPYLGRTKDLHRRLARLLASPRASSKMLNLRAFARRVDYQAVGSTFEAQWLLYLLNRFYYPRLYRQRLRLRPPALLKVNLRNRFPRCYPTRRLTNDGSLYYGPFPSRAAAERFAGEFLDLFKIRRCHEDLNPDPSHPGCIYSQMKMCLAPCFQGCTDDEYRQEVGRVVEFLDAAGKPLLLSLEAERARASEALAFEEAAATHRRIEKVHEALRLRPDLVRNLSELHAVIIVPGAQPKSVAFFRLSAGVLRGPAPLSLDENVPSPVPLDQRIRAALEPLEANPGPPSPGETAPPWEHLSLLARWYYSSFREGELVPLNPGQQIPHSRLIRTCRKILADTGL